MERINKSYWIHLAKQLYGKSFSWKASTVLCSAFRDYLLITGKPALFMGCENLKTTAVCGGAEEGGCAARRAVAKSTCPCLGFLLSRGWSAGIYKASVFRTPVVRSEMLQLPKASYVYDANRMAFWVCGWLTLYPDICMDQVLSVPAALSHSTSASLYRVCCSLNKRKCTRAFGCNKFLRLRSCRKQNGCDNDYETLAQSMCSQFLLDEWS